MRQKNTKQVSRFRAYLKRGWRTVPEIMAHVGLTRRSAYRWLGSFWLDVVKRGSRDHTQYKICD
jgi:hypothetical protein